MIEFYSVKISTPNYDFKLKLKSSDKVFIPLIL